MRTATALLVLLAVAGAGCSAAAAADGIQPAPPEFRALIGKTTPRETSTFSVPGWEKDTGALVGYLAWQGSPTVAVSAFGSGRRVVVTAEVEVGRVGPRPLYRMQDAIMVVSRAGRATLLVECRVGLGEDAEPGLVALVETRTPVLRRDDGRDDWYGPAAAAWRVDRYTQRLTRETRAVYCMSEGGD